MEIIKETIKFSDIKQRNTCFAYTSCSPPTTPQISVCDPLLYNLFRSKQSTDEKLIYNGGTINIHSSVVLPYLHSLTLEVDEPTAQVFCEWCYCKSSPTLDKMAPFGATKACIQLLRAYEAKQIWNYIESYSVMLSVLLPDVSFEFLSSFDNIDMIEDHQQLFKDITFAFFSNFNICGGNDFIKYLPKDILLQCLDVLCK
ncbi:Ankyrin repeat protein [Entamoeba marina]